MTETQKPADLQIPPDGLVPGRMPGRELTDLSGTLTLSVTAQAAQPDAQMAPQTAAQLALHAGWTMAVLYGAVLYGAVLYGEMAPGASGRMHLPTASELPSAERRGLEVHRLRHLLWQLASLAECAGSGLPTEVPAPATNPVEEAVFKDSLEALNLAILGTLAAASPDIELAYQLGRALRDTVDPPRAETDMSSPTAALARQLTYGRVSRLQQWLAILSTQFPRHTAAIVAASIGRWSEFAAVTVSPGNSMLKEDDQADVATQMRFYLLGQGDLWLRLLVGTNPAAGLRRSATILRRLRRRYGFMLVLVAAVLGAVIYLIVTYTSGAVAVLTSIAAIGGSLGITAKGIASMIASVMTKEATRPIFSLAGEAEEDAMVWAITTMPPVRLTARGVRRLRKAGIAATSTLGQV